VGVTPNLPPVIFRQDRKITGLEADFAVELGREIGREIRFVAMPWEDLIPALRKAKIDIIMSGMSITVPRSAHAAFTEPYLRVGQLALVHHDDLARYTSPVMVQVSDARIGVEKGTTGDTFVQQHCPRAMRVPFDSAQAAADALIANKIELVIHDAPTVWWLAGTCSGEGLTFPDALLTEEYLAWAVKPDNRDLLHQANEVLDSWHYDGTLDRIMQRWLPYAQ
jgi:polar amino acid transport system substrate-binding protein